MNPKPLIYTLASLALAAPLLCLDAAGSASLITTYTSPIPAKSGNFGWPVVAVGTDTVLIGAFYDSTFAQNGGAAYLFDLSGKLLSTFAEPAPHANSVFGLWVAAVGTDKVLIGAPASAVYGVGPGAAYLFDLSGKLLTTFVQPAPAVDDHFGICVAAVGTDKVLIGADGVNSPGAYRTGAAYLFDLNGTLLQTFTHPALQAYAFFGNSFTAVGADKVLFGVTHDSAIAISAGAAFLFDLKGTLLRSFTEPTPLSMNEFGWSVAAVGADKVLIGAPVENNFSGGAAYLFDLSGNMLQKFTKPSPHVDDLFGWSVAAVGADKVLIGARVFSTPVSGHGEAYLFDLNGTLLQTLTKPNYKGGEEFSRSLAAVDTARVLIGAPHDSATAPYAGAAYLFCLDSPAITQQPVDLWVAEGSPATLQVVASGSPPLQYQWSKGNLILLNETNDMLSISAAQMSDAGVYRVVVSNPCGAIASDPVALVVSEGYCLDYGDLAPVGSTWSCGQEFVSRGITNGVGEFHYLNGGSTAQGFAILQSSTWAGQPKQAIFTDNATLFFEYPLLPACLSLRFAEYGGSVDLKVNGHWLTADTLSGLKPQTVGGVFVSVSQGRLYLVGLMFQVGVGGQELAITDVCAGFAPVVPPTCVDFEDLPPAYAYHFGDKFGDVLSHVALAALAFRELNGTLDTTGTVTVQPAGGNVAGASGQEMRASDANLGFDFGQTWPGVSVQFGGVSGPVNLMVGTDLVAELDIIQLNNQTVGGVPVKVTVDPQSGKGVLLLLGKVRTFALGAEQIYIDHVCPYTGSALKADLNGDGKVDFGDAGQALGLTTALGGLDTNLLTVADVSLDGQVTVVDAALILRVAQGLGGLPTNVVTLDQSLTPRVLRVGNVTAQPGQVVEVPVDLIEPAGAGASRGGAFTLQWDAGLLTLKATLVSSLPIPLPMPAALNTNFVPEGLLGFAFVLDGNSTPWSEGMHRLLTLQFQVARDAVIGGTMIEFQDALAVREWVALTPENDMPPAPAIYEPGVIEIGQEFTRPVVTRFPADRAVTAGDSAVFAVAAQGEGLRYQWFKNGVLLPGAVLSYVELHEARQDQAGFYHVVVSNPAGSATSSDALLQVRPGDEVTFESLPLDRVYPAGSQVVSETIPIDVRLATLQGRVPTNGFARIGNGLQAGGAGQEMFLSDAELNFHFPYLLSGVGFFYEEAAEGVNLRINGDSRSAAHLRDLDGQVVGNVLVQVSQPQDSWQGRLGLVGRINTFAVGGHQLYLDDVSWGRLDSGPVEGAWFDDLSEGTEYQTGDRFTSYGGAFVVGPTYRPEGIAVRGKAMVVGPTSLLGYLDAFGLELVLSNANVTIDFGQLLVGLALEFANPDDLFDNLEINGAPWRGTGPFAALDGQILGGVVISVTTNPQRQESDPWRRGTLHLVGPIRSLAIGGQHVALDNITPYVDRCQRGDVDGDGRITLQDAQQVLRLATGVDLWQWELFCPADASRNEDLDMADVVRVLRAAQGIEAIPDSPVASVPDPIPDVLSVNDTVVKTGDVVEVPVEFRCVDPTAVLGISFTLSWNTELLSFHSGEVSTLPIPTPMLPMLNTEHAADGWLTFGLAAPGPQGPLTNETTRLLLLRFQAKAGLTQNADACIWFNNGMVRLQVVRLKNGQVGLGRVLEVDASVKIVAPDDVPVITQQPLSQTARVGDRLELSVTAWGEGLSYQWYKDGTELEGQVGPILRLDDLTLECQGVYLARVSNAHGDAWSAEANLQLTTSSGGCLDFDGSGTGVGINVLSGTLMIGPFSMFTGTSGEAILIFHGKVGLNFGAPLQSLTLPFAMMEYAEYTLEINGATVQRTDPGLGLLALNGQTLGGVKIFVTPKPYFVFGFVRGQLYLEGTINSFAIGGEFIVIDNICPVYAPQAHPPIITQQPQDLSVPVGSPASFQVTAIGDPVLQYLWSKDTFDLPSQTSDALTIPAAQFSDMGVYQVVVTNLAGKATSDPAVLVVYNGDCVDYEDLAPLGKTWTDGQQFVSRGVTHAVGEFHYLGGGSTAQGTVTLENLGLAGHSGQEIFVDNATVFFEQEPLLSGLSLYFGQSGGNVNLKINGVRLNTARLTDLDGQSVGKVFISVSQNPANGKGRLYLAGPMAQIGLGGQELAIDEVCFAIAPPGPPGCIDFEELPAYQQYAYGDKFVDSAVKLQVEELQQFSGAKTYGGSVLVEPGGHAGGTGQEMLTREARLGFRFGSTWPGVTLLYAESAQPVNLRVGADLKVVPDLMSLNGQTVGGVQVSVAPGASPNQGVLTLNGPVDSFALGAEHLYIDHVCPAGSGTNVTVLGLKMVPMITVTGAPGSSQDVQYREALEPGEIWHPWTTVVLGATGSAVCFDTNAPAGGKRFYRSLQRLAP